MEHPVADQIDGPPWFRRLSWTPKTPDHYTVTVCFAGKTHSSLKKNIKPKKQHEIQRIYDLTTIIRKELNFDLVVDVGSGLGHLSRVLSEQIDMRVVTVEGNETFVSRAKELDAKFSSKICNFTSSVKCKDVGVIPDEIDKVKTLENFKRVHDSIKRPVWSRRVVKFVSIQFGGWAAVSGSASAQRSTVGARAASLQSPLAKSNSNKFGNSSRTKPAGLIES